MFETGPRLYVYFTYGMHWCANLVCGPQGSASAVLLRAGEVISGIELARQRRTSARNDRDLARGPARLAQAVGLTGEHTGLELSADSPISLLPPPVIASQYETGPRTGVSGEGGDGAHFPWRFWLLDEPTVSPYRAATRRRRTGQT